MLSVFGIFLGLAILVYFSLKGWNVMIVALIASFVVILTSGVPLVETINQVYMIGFKNWAGNFFLMLLTGAIFAKLMDVSGAAQSISDSIMKITGENSLLKIFLGIWFVTTLLVYAGINVWIIVYVMVPIMYPIWKKLDLPWHIALAVFTLGANCMGNWMPGAVTIYNIMPTEYLGTSTTAGWKLMFFTDTTLLALSMFYIFRELKKAKARGEGFVKPEGLIVTDVTSKELPNIFIALLPIIVTLVTLNILKMAVFIALSLGIITCIVVMYKYIPNLIETLDEGAKGAGLPVLTTCAVVGFGSVVASVPGFNTLTEAIISGIPGSPYISWTLSVNALAGVTGSASGGMGIALEALAPKFLEMGLNPEGLHRLCSIAACGLDTLPHNGAVVTILSIFGIKYKEGYRHMFIITVLLTVIATIPGIIAAMIFY